MVPAILANTPAQFVRTCPDFFSEAKAKALRLLARLELDIASDIKFCDGYDVSDGDLAVLNIRRAKPEDAPVLTEIAFAAKRNWGYPERWIACWRDLLTITPDFIAHHETNAAIVGDRIVGFYALGSDGPRLELTHLWVRPERIRHGVGRALFLHALARVQALGYDELEIESDPNAEGFYRRMGARRVRVSVGQVDGERRELPVLLCPVGGPIGAAGTACP